MEFLMTQDWSPDIPHTWLGAIKYGISPYSYVWNNSDYYAVDFKLNPYDPIKPTCHDKCCRLMLVDDYWGFLAAVPCKTTDKARSVCLFRPRSSIEKKIRKADTDLYLDTKARERTDTEVRNTQRDFTVLRWLIQDMCEVFNRNMTTLHSLQKRLDSSAVQLEKTLRDYEKELSNVKHTNSVLYSLFGICIVAILLLIAFNINMLIVLTPDKSPYY
jgi:hypothetical protein